jgi:hypothetical protein
MFPIDKSVRSHWEANRVRLDRPLFLEASGNQFFIKWNKGATCYEFNSDSQKKTSLMLVHSRPNKIVLNVISLNRSSVRTLPKPLLNVSDWTICHAKGDDLIAFCQRRVESAEVTNGSLTVSCVVWLSYQREIGWKVIKQKTIPSASGVVRYHSSTELEKDLIRIRIVDWRRIRNADTRDTIRMNSFTAPLDARRTNEGNFKFGAWSTGFAIDKPPIAISTSSASSIAWQSPDGNQFRALVLSPGKKLSSIEFPGEREIQFIGATGSTLFVTSALDGKSASFSASFGDSEALKLPFVVLGLDPTRPRILTTLHNRSDHLAIRHVRP